MSGWMPFFRNHNVKGAIDQAPYVWDSVAEVTRNVLKARYSLLPYWETLFNEASRYGTPPLRPLFFSFDVESLYSNSKQFMVGEFILVTPVLEPNATTVTGVLPTQGGTTWRNFYTHELVKQTSDLVTLSAPLLEIPVHIRSGAVLLMHQKPAYTIYETKQEPYSLLVNLDHTGYATGCAKIDDGISLPSTGTKSITWEASGNSLKTLAIDDLDGVYDVPQKLAEITILGVDKPKTVTANGKKVDGFKYEESLQRLIVQVEIDLNTPSTIEWTS